MADEHPTSRTLSRALNGPARAMSRVSKMLGVPPPEASADGAAGPIPSAIIDCALYVDGVRQPGAWHYADALAAARDRSGAFVWVGLKEPGHAELAELGQTFQLHELPVEDAVKSKQRPKVERYPNMTFLTLRTARYCEHEELTETSDVVETGDMMLFIGEHYVISVRHGDACQLRSVRVDLEKRPELLAQGPWAVAYAICDMVVDVFMDVSSAMEEDVAEIEDFVYSPKGGRHDQIQRVYQLKREVMEFKRAVLPLQRPLSGLVSGQLEEVPGEVRRYFRDVSDHLTRTVEQVVYFDDVLNSILQARLAQVTVDQNNDMRKIAAWAGIAAVWTAIAGIEGMNFPNMPEQHWAYGYPVVFTIIVVISAAMYVGFRRSGWL